MAPSDGGRSGQLSSSGLRPGWTTGASACAATRAAFVGLLTGEFPDPVTVLLPQGRTPAFALTKHELGDGWAQVVVTKDAGDDPDLTHGALITSRVRRGEPGTGVVFLAGEGVGRVTLPGLPLPVGEPAINPMPRQYITENLQAAASELGVERGDLEVVIGVVGGAEMATHTLNPRLGVIGGLSILGTTGVVVPYSCSAWIDSIKRGVDVARATGLTHLAASTGSTSERVATERYGLPELALLDMGDFAGAVLKYVRTHPVERLTIVGGVAKMAKLADGHLDLHSGRSTIDLGFLADLAREAGGDDALVAEISGGTTVLHAVTAAADAGVDLARAIADAAKEQALSIIDGAPVTIDVVCIDRAGVVLAATD